MQCQKIAEKLKQNLPSVSTERREAQPLREERDPFTFLRIAALNIREAREDLKYIGCYHACRNGDMEILYHAVRQDARLEYAVHGSESFLWIQALIALSGNDHDLVIRMLPRDTAYYDRAHTIHKVLGRLLTALYYRDNDLGSRALKASETFLCQKHPKIWLLTAQYLCALWRKETGRLSSCSQRSAQRSGNLIFYWNSVLTAGISLWRKRSVSLLTDYLPWHSTASLRKNFRTSPFRKTGDF